MGEIREKNQSSGPMTKEELEEVIGDVTSIGNDKDRGFFIVGKVESDDGTKTNMSAMMKGHDMNNAMMFEVILDALDITPEMAMKILVRIMISEQERKHEAGECECGEDHGKKTIDDLIE